MEWSRLASTSWRWLAYQFDAAHPFHDGLARVRVGGKEGFIDRTGRFVVPPRYEWANDFGGEMAPVKVGSGGGSSTRRVRRCWSRNSTLSSRSSEDGGT